MGPFKSDRVVYICYTVGSRSFPKFEILESTPRELLTYVLNTKKKMYKPEKNGDQPFANETLFSLFYLHNKILYSRFFYEIKYATKNS